MDSELQRFIYVERTSPSSPLLPRYTASESEPVRASSAGLGVGPRAYLMYRAWVSLRRLTRCFTIVSTCDVTAGGIRGMSQFDMVTQRKNPRLSHSTTTHAYTSAERYRHMHCGMY